MGVSQGQREEFSVEVQELISNLIRPFQRMPGTTIGHLAHTVRVSRDEA